MLNKYFLIDEWVIMLHMYVCTYILHTFILVYIYIISSQEKYIQFFGFDFKIHCLQFHSWFPRCMPCPTLSLYAPIMVYRGQGQKVQKVMVQPINLIFWYHQNRSQIQVWIYEQVNMLIEGCITGFDEYMNLVLDDAEEIHSKTKSREQLGRIMLKGDNITTKCL
ncbi:small nuclear ribonucleoprotein E-like [Notamacropus eugenii]|uniref:small nuclear ribonucleoprotein E-like n=1 Tax=Notamacropus eugenii TaxID=9315 RepID=UPI003B66C904